MLSNTFSPVLAIAGMPTQPVELSAAAVFLTPGLLYALPVVAEVVGPGVLLWDCARGGSGAEPLVCR